METGRLKSNQVPEISDFVERDSEKLGGEPVFRGTRVPVKTLFAYLSAGDALELFLDDFPGVTQQQAIGVLEVARDHLVQEVK